LLSDADRHGPADGSYGIARPGRPAMTYQQAVGGDNLQVKAISTDQTIHRGTFARPVPQWKAWFDGPYAVVRNSSIRFGNRSLWWISSNRLKTFGVTRCLAGSGRAFPLPPALPPQRPQRRR